MKHLSSSSTAQNKSVSIWLIIMCIAIVFMIVIGGITRLTNSGLSIVEWKPASGIIPPLNLESWEIEFNKYKQFPEYITHNVNMSLKEFQFIYLIEFYHRIAGRITAILYVIPMIYFILSGKIKKSEIRIYTLALMLFAGQGLMGWYMVKSGLIDNNNYPHVSHYRLAAHLIIAIFLYIILFSKLIKNKCKTLLLPIGVSINHPKFWCMSAISILICQIIFGAFVAGLRAGFIYNSFPLMGHSFIPPELLQLKVSMSILSEPVAVQFIHRTLAYILCIVIIIFCLLTLILKNKKLFIAVCAIVISLFLQMLAGILTIIYVVPIPIALLHQLGAIILLSCLLWSYFLLFNSQHKNA